MHRWSSSTCVRKVFVDEINHLQEVNFHKSKVINNVTVLELNEWTGPMPQLSRLPALKDRQAPNELADLLLEVGRIGRPVDDSLCDTAVHHDDQGEDRKRNKRPCTEGLDRVLFFRVRAEYEERASSTSQVHAWSFEYESSFEYKSSIIIQLWRGLSPFPKVLLSLIQTNFDSTEYMKLPEKCELSNLFEFAFYKATFHFRLDFRQTRILNLATCTRLEIVVRLEVV